MAANNVARLTVDLGGTAGATDGADGTTTTAAHTAKVAAKFLTRETPTIEPDRPCWAVYKHWVANEKGRKLKPGVYWHGFKRTAADDDSDDNAGRPITDEWISTPVSVAARTTNSDDGSEGRLLLLATESGIKEWIIPMEVFGGSGEDARRQLFGMGVIIAPKKRSQFMEYLLEQRPSEVFATTCRPGWHESGAFVLPGRTIGSDKVRYQVGAKGQNLFSLRGDLQGWKNEVAAKCEGNPVLTLSIGCALAGPLLSLVGVLGGGVHLVGDSSSGKSLAQLIGSSVWGDPGIFAASWDMTKGGLEIEASSRNDTMLPLDEIKRADPKRVQEMAYSLANGQGKGTMTRDREARGKLSWRLLALSSGERSLSEHAAISGNAAHAGAELRMVDVNAGTRTHRAFDELHGMAGADFHRVLTVAVAAHHGHIGPAFVEKLIATDDRPGLLEDFAGIRAQFLQDNAQAGRVADRFAVIALAGEMAIAYGLLPWTPGSALADCQLLYGEWLSRVGSGNAEDRQILAGILDFIDKHGSSRFSDVDDQAPDAKVFNRAGYWERIGTKRLYLFNKSALIEAAHGHGLDRVIKALEGVGALAKRDTDRDSRKTKKYRLPAGGSARLYVIDPEVMDGEGGSV
jgi:putative DNA primase/helicase